MRIAYFGTALLLILTALVAAPAIADDVAPSARVSSAVLVREGPTPQSSAACAPATARRSSAR